MHYIRLNTKSLVVTWALCCLKARTPLQFVQQVVRTINKKTHKSFTFLALCDENPHATGYNASVLPCILLFSLHFGPSYSFMIFEMGPRTFARTKATYAEKSIVTVGSIKQNGQNISHLHIFAITVCVDLLTNNHYDVIKTLLCTWLRKLCIDFLCRVPHLSHRIFACKCRLRNMPKPANSCHNWI